MRRLTSPVMWGLLALAVVAVAAVLIGAGSGGGSAHQVSVVVPHATALRKGFVVRQSGRAVGHVASVDLQPDYRVRIAIDLDDAGWPLPKDTRFVARTGGTIKLGDRYLEIRRGKSGTPMAEDQQLPASSYVDPVEFDTLFNTFDARTRRDVRSTLSTSAVALRGVKDHLKGAVRYGPAAAASVEDVTRQLGEDPARLDRLVRMTDAVAAAASTADPGLSTLIDNANTTFSAVSTQTEQLRRSLTQLPATLTRARGIATDVQPTLRLVDQLTRKLAPGTAQLRAIAAPLGGVLTTVQDVAPTGTATLRTLGRAAPRLNQLVDRVADPLMPQIEEIGRHATKQIDCLRPYSPEIAGLAVNWAGFFGIGDASSKFARAQAGVIPFPSETPINSAALVKLLGPTVRYSFPRPPGENAGQPWYQPQCGITADSADPSKDPEATHFAPTSKKLLDFDPPGRSKGAGR